MGADRKMKPIHSRIVSQVKRANLSHSRYRTSRRCHRLWRADRRLGIDEHTRSCSRYCTRESRGPDRGGVFQYRAESDGAVRCRFASDGQRSGDGGSFGQNFTGSTQFCSNAKRSPCTSAVGAIATTQIGSMATASSFRRGAGLA